MEELRIRVNLWGTTVGYLIQPENGAIQFQYDADFRESGIQISPLTMPLSAQHYSFPDLPERTFRGLPGMVADSLPDRFGNIVLRHYLAGMGRQEESLSPLERLCFTGKRGMGALEYEPSTSIGHLSKKIDLDALATLASGILAGKEKIRIRANDRMTAQLMETGSSAGGARAKTLLAWNPATNDIRSGQIEAGKGYEYWLLKFDGIGNNRDKDDEPDAGGYTKIEYAYYRMALLAGIEMSECRLLRENGRSHFMTKRFDRDAATGGKIHMQSLCAIAHMDFNRPRFYSYNDAFAVLRNLALPYNAFLQLYKRMVFSEYAKNYDDHTKNIAFLMNRSGEWSLSPAYDMTFSYKKDSIWVSAHQMLINGKAEDITVSDFLSVADRVGIRKGDAETCIEQVRSAVSRWPECAEEADLLKKQAETIHRLLKA